MPPRVSQQQDFTQYFNRIIGRVRHDGAIIVDDLGTGRSYDGNDQAFIVCAVLHFTRDELRDAYWRYEREARRRKDVSVGVLLAIEDYVRTQALDPEQDEHWKNVQAIAHGAFMIGLVTDCTGSLTQQIENRLGFFATYTYIQHGQPNSAICAAFTNGMDLNGDIVVKSVWYHGLEFDIHSQAFILCAVTNKLLAPQSLNSAYLRYKGWSQSLYLANTLRAIATYIHIERSSYEDADMLGVQHWNAVLDMANDPDMQAFVGGHSLG